MTQEEWFNLIDEYRLLENDWDSYGADKISDEVIAEAKKWVEDTYKLGYEIYHICPGPNGEISIELKNDDKYIDMLIYPDKIQKYYAYHNYQFVESGILTPSIFGSPLIKWLYENKQ